MRYLRHLLRRRREPAPPATISLAEAAARVPAAKVVAVEQMRPILTPKKLVRMFAIDAAFDDAQIAKFTRVIRGLSEAELVGLEADCLAIATDPHENAVVRHLGLTVAEVARTARGGRKPNPAAIQRMGEIGRNLLNV